MIKEIIKELEDIASDCGDNMDRVGEYSADKIRAVIEKLERLEREVEVI